MTYNMRAQLDRIETDVKDIRDRLHGPASGEPGLITTVHELKRDSERRSWFARTALGAAIGASITSIAALIHGSHQ